MEKSYHEFVENKVNNTNTSISHANLNFKTPRVSHYKVVACSCQWSLSLSHSLYLMKTSENQRSFSVLGDIERDKGMKKCVNDFSMILTKEAATEGFL